MSDTGLAALAAWAESQLPQLIDDACTAVLARISMYRTGEPVSPAELRGSVETNLGFLVAAIGNPDAPLDLSAPQATGRRRAHEGAPLPEVLQAYRVSFATLWNALVVHAQQHRPAVVDVLLTASSRVWQITDEHALALTEAYRAATAELLLSQQRRRSALVEALLTGHSSPAASRWEAAALLGLPPDGSLVVVAAETRSLAEESLPRIESRLAARGLASGWRLTPAQQLGVVSLGAGQREALLEVLQDTATARTGVSPTYASLADTPRALHLAQSALAGIAVGETGVCLFSSSPLAALMVCEPLEGQRLAEQVLGGVLGLPTEDRSPLLETLSAYLDHEGSAERAADVLFCHPNTVRYRRRRLQELTGRSLSDPRAVAELTAAAYALRHIADTSPRAQPPRRGARRGSI